MAISPLLWVICTRSRFGEPRNAASPPEKSPTLGHESPTLGHILNKIPLKPEFIQQNQWFTFSTFVDFASPLLWDVFMRFRPLLWDLKSPTLGHMHT